MAGEHAGQQEGIRLLGRFQSGSNRVQKWDLMPSEGFPISLPADDSVSPVSMDRAKSDHIYLYGIEVPRLVLGYARISVFECMLYEIRLFTFG
jgi:hypothetical protein